MSVTIYHNPRCSKSRQTLEIIQSKGIDPKIIEYLNAPPSVEELETLFEKLDINPRDVLRKKEAGELGLNDPAINDNTLIEKISENPIVIERPIVVTAKGAKICRPPELVEELL